MSPGLGSGGSTYLKASEEGQLEDLAWCPQSHPNQSSATKHLPSAYCLVVAKGNTKVAKLKAIKASPNCSPINYLLGFQVARFKPPSLKSRACCLSRAQDPRKLQCLQSSSEVSPTFPQSTNIWLPISRF